MGVFIGLSLEEDGSFYRPFTGRLESLGVLGNGFELVTLYWAGEQLGLMRQILFWMTLKTHDQFLNLET
jgi:hypothetical protein